MTDTVQPPDQISAKKTLHQRLIDSPIVACVCGSAILWISFGIRQTFGVYLIPVTHETGWSRSTFSIAAALLQLLWGFGQPFIVYLAERKIGFGKTIFFASIFYAVGCFILYASSQSPGLFIFGMGVVIGISVGGNSFPIVLASIGRRFPQNSKYQSIAFGIVSSFGSFGQCLFLPIARGMIDTIGWRLSLVISGVIIAALSPLAYFLQSVPPKPAERASKEDIEETSTTSTVSEKETTEKKVNDKEEKQPVVDISAPNIKTALKQAFTSPIYIFITLGFSVCGFHIAFIATHFPAYLQDRGIDSSLAAWTISIIGLGSTFGTILAGYLCTVVQPRFVLMSIYLLRAVLIVILLFLPTTVASTVVFSVLFGPLSLSTVPPTTKFIGDSFGHKYLGTLTSISFIGHQIGSFLGAYVSGVIYDRTHDYSRMWYGSFAVAILAVGANFLAGFAPIVNRKPVVTK
ncbi:MFS general substrate transporter [Rhizopus microsporus var. microsporus]|uniref:MFS general substrate transporter n=1 Tax=Rhizopus microsporus var. microsporus TaxID=86635 RepID=A0A1X0QUU9_RHIZD|nr:MFS general substrate transporter [Rhizopus microsporus var. microsporus]